MAYDANVNQFDVARKRAAQQNTAQVQNQQDALKRRFAASGSLNSGAAIKQQELTAEKGNENLAQVNEGITAAESQENQRQREIQEGRAYGTSERLGSQQFAAEQAGLGREFTRSERLGSQDFGAGQAELQRKWSSGERMSAQDFQAAQAGLARDIQNSQFYKQLEQAKNQFDENLKQQKWVDAENVRLGDKALDHQGWMDKLLNPTAGWIGGVTGGIFGGQYNGGIAGSLLGGGPGAAAGQYYGGGNGGSGGYTGYGI